MTFFDLTPAQRGFYKGNNDKLKLNLYLAFIEAGGGLSLSEYNAYISGSKPAPAPVEPAPIRIDITKLEKRILSGYKCPHKNIQVVMSMCRNLKFRYWKKAARCFYDQGYYTISKSYSQGGTTDIFVMTRKGNISKMFENVDHKCLKKILKIIIESR